LAPLVSFRSHQLRDARQIHLFVAAFVKGFDPSMTAPHVLTPDITELQWNGWNVKINDVYFTDSVPQVFGDPRTADTDSEFVRFSVTVTNASHEGQRFIPQNSLKIIIGDNAFDAEDIEGGSKESYAANIEPTLTRTRECYFELPKAVVKDSFVIRFGSFLTENKDVTVTVLQYNKNDANPIRCPRIRCLTNGGRRYPANPGLSRGQEPSYSVYAINAVMGRAASLLSE
jgi:hypothetical protein